MSVDTHNLHTDVKMWFILIFWAQHIHLQASVSFLNTIACLNLYVILHFGLKNDLDEDKILSMKNWGYALAKS